MRRNGILFGALLVLLGLLLLLSNLGVIAVDVWSLLWPLALIAIGGSLLWAVLAGPRTTEVEEAEVRLQEAGRAHLRLRHAAGRLTVTAGAAPGLLLSGRFGGGVEKRIRPDADGLRVELSLPRRAFPSFLVPGRGWSGHGLEWVLALSPEVPLTLSVDSGASENRLDLSALMVTELRVETGASSTEVTLPAAAGYTRAHISSGAASTVVNVPEGVGARIQTEGALSDINVSPRFERLAAGQYQSPDYAVAPNKVDLKVETGVGASTVR